MMTLTRPTPAQVSGENATATHGRRARPARLSEFGSRMGVARLGQAASAAVIVTLYSAADLGKDRYLGCLAGSALSSVRSAHQTSRTHGMLAQPSAR